MFPVVVAGLAGGLGQRGRRPGRLAGKGCMRVGEYDIAVGGPRRESPPVRGPKARPVRLDIPDLVAAWTMGIL